jgi:hypothetical protein
MQLNYKTLRTCAMLLSRLRSTTERRRLGLLDSEGVGSTKNADIIYVEETYRRCYYEIPFHIHKNDLLTTRLGQ